MCISKYFKVFEVYKFLNSLFVYNIMCYMQNFVSEYMFSCILNWPFATFSLVLVKLKLRFCVENWQATMAQILELVPLNLQIEEFNLAIKQTIFQ